MTPLISKYKEKRRKYKLLCLKVLNLVTHVAVVAKNSLLKLIHVCRLNHLFDCDISPERLFLGLLVAPTRQVDSHTSYTSYM